MLWNATAVKKYTLITITFSLYVNSSNSEICTENDYMNKYSWSSKYEKDIWKEQINKSINLERAREGL